MNDWSDVVTTALLGTGRRGVPADLPGWWAEPAGSGVAGPEFRLLELAAAHRAVAAASPAPEHCSQPAVGPPTSRRPAPHPAAVLLTGLLTRPEPGLINQWLQACAEHGCTPPAEHWAALAVLANRSIAYDRRLLGQTLGDRGRWFLQQNPEWRRAAAAVKEPEVQSDVPQRPVPPVDPEALAADPDLIFAHPDPWPDHLVAAAFAMLGRGHLGSRSRTYATSLGRRLPLRLYRGIAEAAGYYLLAPEASPAHRRAVRSWFDEIERLTYARLQIDRAFSESPNSAEPLPRSRVPPV